MKSDNYNGYLGRVTKVLWTGAEIRKVDDPKDMHVSYSLLFASIKRDCDPEKMDRLNKLSEIVQTSLAYIRVGNKVYVMDNGHKIYGIIREETHGKFVVEFDEHVKCDIEVYYEQN